MTDKHPSYSWESSVDIKKLQKTFRWFSDYSVGLEILRVHFVQYVLLSFHEYLLYYK